MTTLEILKAARELISVPERWTRDYYAKTEDGLNVASNDPRAVKWCALGAIERGGKHDRGASSDTEDFIEKLIGNPSRSLASFNDSHTHPDVLALFDRAIAKLESVEP